MSRECSKVLSKEKEQSLLVCLFPMQFSSDNVSIFQSSVVDDINDCDVSADLPSSLEKPRNSNQLSPTRRIRKCKLTRKKKKKKWKLKKCSLFVMFLTLTKAKSKNNSEIWFRNRPHKPQLSFWKGIHRLTEMVVCMYFFADILRIDPCWHRW